MSTTLLHEHTMHEIRVIDSDTIECWIDLQRMVRIKRRVRLRGIEGGELQTTQGQQTKQQLCSMISSRSNQNPRLIGKLTHVDQHDRIVADIGFDDGKTLVDMCLRTGLWWLRSRSGKQTEPAAAQQKT